MNLSVSERRCALIPLLVWAVAEAAASAMTLAANRRNVFMVAPDVTMERQAGALAPEFSAMPVS
jgi:hypothetical protein